MALDTSAAAGKTVWTYLALVVGLSIPFWLLDSLVGPPGHLPIRLPASALMALTLALAAGILIHRESGTVGVRAWLRRALDAGRVRRPVWSIVAAGYMPIAMLVEYAIMRALGRTLPPPRITLATIVVFCVAFLIAAATEELGWTAFALDRMRSCCNALGAALIIGTVWALWHMIPWLSVQSPSWAVWQGMNTISTRVLLVWLYYVSGRSVLAVIVMHAMLNTSEFLFPADGSHYDPFLHFVVVTCTAVVVIVLPESRSVWGLERQVTNRR
jgi:membrane protease YdiL (CAAX protease family)